MRRDARTLWSITLLGIACLAPAPLLDAAAADREPATIVGLPLRLHDTLTAGCIEFRVQETGGDVRVRLQSAAMRLLGADGGIRGYGLQELVFCSDAARAYELTIEPAGRARHAPRLRVRKFAADAPQLPALRTLATAFANLGADAPPAETAATFAAAGTQLDRIDERKRAALAWLIADRLAEIAVDRRSAQRAFDAALAHVHALHWTRAEVVVLNNRALFLQASETALARRLIERSFALQRRLHDAALGAAIENNVCLLRHEYGDLRSARGCFERVLADLERLQARVSTIGATRNNLALVDLSDGRYAKAAAAFRRAARERLDGGDRQGHVLSLGNLALCLYQLGDLEGALRELHGAYAAAGDDAIARAQVAAYLAAMYLAWGDVASADAFAGESEAVFRRTGRVADLAPTLRLRARIEADAGRLDAARDVIDEAWKLALANDQRRAAANIAGVYADILLQRGDVAAARKFIDAAETRFSGHAERSNLLSLLAVKVRCLRLAGDRAAARTLAARLLAQLPFPGALRTRALLERYLIELDGDRACTTCARRYAGLLANVRNDVAAAPDPELALRLLDTLRPAADATLAAQLADCRSGRCAAAALASALDLFALQRDGLARPAATDDPELRGLLQSLSRLEAGGDISAAPAQIRTRLAELQAVARLRGRMPAPAPCTACVQSSAAGLDLVYYFGAQHGWRWERTAGGWSVRELPPWSRIAAALRRLDDAAARRAALRDLSPLVRDLGAGHGAVLQVGGDPRIAQIPLAALDAGDGGALLDHYALRVRSGAAPALAAALPRVEFLSSNGSGGAPLPMADVERATLRAWSARNGLAFDAGDDAAMRPRLLHISAHGQRDIGTGAAVLWLRDRPLLSFVFGPHAVADTVVINACDSAAAPDAAFSAASIAAGFLRGGARQVVATLYPIGDHAAAAFTRAFYDAYDPRRDNLAAAVRVAQLALRSHPSAGDAWAAYVVLATPDG